MGTEKEEALAKKQQQKQQHEEMILRTNRGETAKKQQQKQQHMHIQPSDIDRVRTVIAEAMIGGILWVLDAGYRWYRKRQAPYYVPPPQASSILPSPYEDVPQASYPELIMEQKERVDKWNSLD